MVVKYAISRLVLQKKHSFQHGLGASAERWESVIPLFAKKFRVIVPDLIGFGYSDKPMIDYTTDYFAEFVSKFVVKLGLKR